MVFLTIFQNHRIFFRTHYKSFIFKNGNNSTHFLLDFYLVINVVFIVVLAIFHKSYPSLIKTSNNLIPLMSYAFFYITYSYTIYSVNLIKFYVHHFKPGGWNILSDIIRPYRKLPVTPVNQHCKLNHFRSSSIHQSVNRRSYRPSVYNTSSTRTIFLSVIGNLFVFRLLSDARKACSNHLCRELYREYPPERSFPQHP